MKIGIISDTHKKLKKATYAIDTLVADGAEFLIHAGDIVEKEVLELLKKSTLRYIAVYGNNDAHLLEFDSEFNLVVEPYYFKLGGKTFKLMHLPYFLTPDVDIVIFGHTHVQNIELDGKTLFLNSGEVCARDSDISSWMMLELTKDEYIITSYTKEKKSQTLQRATKRFKV
ncbi:MAG: YfcE family phosphodiesterase [Sulfurimonas sp.]|jgi:putative phosphoesterase|nr:YfcE family phosphodiesterase [Sulfurimonadaceae bacterium]